ncbi:hypothetical protein ABFX02_11G098300 [Erythranthe guttata]
MQSKNPFLQRRFINFKHICRTINFSSQPNSSSSSFSSSWVHHNQLFQRHTRLQLLEETCRRSFNHIKHLLSYVFVSGLHRNPFVMSRLLYLTLIQSEIPEFGIRIFDQIEKPNTFSWNTMIRFFSARDPITASDYYMKMLSREMVPDKYTFPFLLQACGTISDLGSVKQVHCHVLKLHLADNLFVENSLLTAYLACNSAADARQVFDEMSDRDVVSWTSLISGLVSQSYYTEAIHVLKKMMADEYDSRVKPNIVTIISATSACGGLGSMDPTKCMHAFLEKSGWIELDISITNSLIDAYAKSGDLSNARKLFDDIQESTNKRDLYSWTSIILAYAMHGQGQEALNMLSQMEQIYKVAPDAVTFVAALSACAHSGLVEEGLSIFESMTKNYGIAPDLRHYGCIVDLLGRAGLVERAYNIVENMPMEPNLAVLGSLLSGCRVHNELDFGECVLRKIEFLNERGGASVLLSNIYANENRWSDVVRIRKEMRGGVMKGKPPGRSWIQVLDRIHEFVARNGGNNTQGLELHMVLEGLEKISRL